MGTDDEAGGSPPCLACEMDEAYAGFLPAEELAAELLDLLRLADQAPDPVRARWRGVLEPALRRLPEPADRVSPKRDTMERDLTAATRKLLPRIADDRLHAALKSLLQP